MYKDYFDKQQVERFLDKLALFEIRTRTVCLTSTTISIILKVLNLLPNTSWWTVLTPLLIWYAIFTIIMTGVAISSIVYERRKKRTETIAFASGVDEQSPKKQ